MCGIVGARDDWLRANGLDPTAAMRAAVGALRWRGPDGEGLVRVGNWWLGCARLAITQAGSRQPVVRRGGRRAAVLNGAITNARELWAELLPRAERRSAPPNDAWLPLLAVERGRRDLLERLRGHHAFVVVDLDHDEFVYGRDRYGEKPLLLLRDPRDRATVHAFASAAQALRQFGPTDLTAGFDTATWFACGFAARGGSQPEEAGRAPLRPGAPAPVRDRLIASVARCADTTVAAGLFLSGGIDSSCLAAALHANGRSLPAFQFRATGETNAERALAQAVAAHCDLPFHAVDGGPEVLDALPQLTRCAGLPLGDPSVLAVHAVARVAAATGVKVMLGGEGADELFYGYRRYTALARLPRLRWLRATAAAWATGYLARWWRAVTADDPIAALLAVVPPAFRTTVLAPDLCSNDAAAAPVRERGMALAERARDADIDGYLRLDLLPKVDVATMAAGIEARCPYLEADPAPDASASDDLDKRRLRAAFAGELPTAVWTQKKRGFALPLDRWFRGDLPLLDLLHDRRTQQRPHLAPGGVTAVVDRHRRRRCNLGHGLYLLAAYESFLRDQEESADRSGKPGRRA